MTKQWLPSGACPPLKLEWYDSMANHKSTYFLLPSFCCGSPVRHPLPRRLGLAQECCPPQQQRCGERRQSQCWQHCKRPNGVTENEKKKGKSKPVPPPHQKTVPTQSCGYMSITIRCIPFWQRHQFSEVNWAMVRWTLLMFGRKKV